MSYWETLLVILRRWRLSVPAALMAIGIATAAFFVSPPAYEDTTQILFIGSPVQPGETARVNPYLGLGSALVQTAAVIQATISTPQVADSLQKEGATAIYLVSADLSTPAPVLLLTTKDADPAIARKTRNAVVAAMKKELLEVQQNAGAPVSQYVSTTIISELPAPQRKLNASIRPAITAGFGFFALAMFALFLLEGRRQRKNRTAEGPTDRVPSAPPVEQAPQPAPIRSPHPQQAPRPAAYAEPLLREVTREPVGRPQPVRRYAEPPVRAGQPAQPGRPVPTLLPTNSPQQGGVRRPAGEPYPRGQQPPGRQGPAGRTPPAGNPIPRRAQTGAPTRPDGSSWFDGFEDEVAQGNGNGKTPRDADGRPIRRK